MIVLKPLGDRLVIEAIEQDETTASGILIPETAKEKPQEGKVVAAGPGRRDDEGERIPMDGQILTGESAVNQAPITGESVPVEKVPGHEVYAGTVNGQGALTVRVTRLAADTTIARAR